MRKPPKKRVAKIRAKGGARPPTPAASTFAVRALDPVQKCGPSTSVRLLFRIDERADAGERTHLVFFDRHGWYCEHGRDCSAVAHAQRAAHAAAE